jgi:hypothetical protein
MDFNGTNSDVFTEQIINDASNIRPGENPAYAVSDFLTVYPQFGEDALNKPIVDPEIIQMFIDLAQASVKQTRFRTAWKLAMGYFVAHFATLFLQGTSDPKSGAGAVLAAGQARGLKTSKSAGDVSISYDFNSITQDLNGWAAWKLTIYGQQLATLAKMYGKGGMGVW